MATIVPSVPETIEAALKGNIVPDQEFLLQASILDTSVNILLDRIRGLCDSADSPLETFNDHEVVLVLKDFTVPPNAGPNPSVTLRVRRPLDRPQNVWQLRYLGQPELGHGPTILRNCLDIPVTSNVIEFLQELGAKMDYEFVCKGYVARKGRIKIQVFKLCRLTTNAQNKESLDPISMSHIVEVSACTTRTDESIGEELRTFADQLKPLCQLEKIDYRRVPPM